MFDMSLNLAIFSNKFILIQNQAPLSGKDLDGFIKAEMCLPRSAGTCSTLIDRISFLVSVICLFLRSSS